MLVRILASQTVASRASRALACLAVAFLAGLASSEVRAAEQDRTGQCLDAYAGGQRSRKAGALRDAKSAFAYCASDSCPVGLHGDCGRWFDEVEAAIPTSVFRVSTSAGAPLAGVGIRIDGGAKQELDGQAVAFDPGEHTIVFSRVGYRELERRFSFSESEKLTQNEVLLEPLSLPQASPVSGRPVARQTGAPADEPRVGLLPSWIAAGIGAAGFVSFAYFGSTARAGDRALDGCSPHCDAERVERVKREYLVANVSAGVGAAGLFAAAAWLIFRPSAKPSPPSGGAEEALALQLGPVSTLTGRF
jgi:hypothetical protein